MWLCLQQIFEMRSHCGCLWLNDRCRRREARCQPCAKHRRFPLPPGDRPRISPYFRRGRHNQHLFVLVPITQTTQVRSRNVHQYDDRASMTGVSWFSTRRTRPSIAHALDRGFTHVHRHFQDPFLALDHPAGTYRHETPK
jgi:hypothetical protein